MKIKYIIIIAAILICKSVYSQIDNEVLKANEIFISYGNSPVSELFFNISNYHIIKQGKGAVNLGYSYRINHIIGLGIIFSYNNIIMNIKEGNASNIDIAKIQHSVIGAIPMLKINWLNTKHVTMYTSVGIGAALFKAKLNNLLPDKYDITVKNSNVKFAYQINPVNIEIGNKNIATFFQLGIGYHGSFICGLRYRL